MEPISLTSIIISVITAIGMLISRMKCKHCKMGCIDSDCIVTPAPSPPRTPTIYVEDVFV